MTVDRRARRRETPTATKLAAVGCVVMLLLVMIAGPTRLGWVLGTELLALAMLGIVTQRSGAFRPRQRARRTVVIGTAAATRALQEELALSDVRGYEVLGRVEAGPDFVPPGADGALGTLSDLRAVIAEHRVDLLLMTDQPSRLEVFDELARHSDDLNVRLWELSGFYEHVFGHIPVAVINSAWFQYILHPRYRPTPPVLKRALDLVVGTCLAIAMLPALVVAVALVWFEGRSIIYRQVRIGEGGRLFTMYKLRTMRQEPEQQPMWCASDDPRVTRVGRWLRRTHIDELPQLVNVIRGEMSLVGPRPEQPHYVARLERALPFYSRRHAIKPGLTGWAQVHCGYAGSEDGSLWKLSHDLYYLKHRSMALDLQILWRSVRTLRTRDQYRDTPVVPFVFRRGVEALPSVTAAEVAPEGASSS